MASKSNGACASRLEKTSAARCRSRHFSCGARRRTRRHPPPWSHALQPYLRSAHRSQMACVGCGRLFLEGSCPHAIPGTKHQQTDFSASLSLSSHTRSERSAVVTVPKHYVEFRALIPPARMAAKLATSRVTKGALEFTSVRRLTYQPVCEGRPCPSACHSRAQRQRQDNPQSAPQKRACPNRLRR